jgi:hypothetical protein
MSWQHAFQAKRTAASKEAAVLQHFQYYASESIPSRFAKKAVVLA